MKGILHFDFLFGIGTRIRDWDLLHGHLVDQKVLENILATDIIAKTHLNKQVLIYSPHFLLVLGMNHMVMRSNQSQFEPIQLIKMLKRPSKS